MCYDTFHPCHFRSLPTHFRREIAQNALKSQYKPPRSRIESFGVVYNVFGDFSPLSLPTHFRREIAQIALKSQYKPPRSQIESFRVVYNVLGYFSPMSLPITSDPLPTPNDLIQSKITIQA